MQDSNILNVCITGAAGHIAYALTPLIAGGSVFGPDVTINLRLLDLPQARSQLERMYMELQDVAYTTLDCVTIGHDPDILFKDADLIIFLAGTTRRPGQERRDLLKSNGSIFSSQAKSLEKVAKKSVKCLVVANPCHTNCLILQENAPSIDKSNFTSLARLDQNRALNHIAIKAGVPVKLVKNVIVWGNHSISQYPDVDHGTIDGKPIRKVIGDDKYIDEEYVKQIQERGMEIIKVCLQGSVLAASNAVKDHLKDWYFGNENYVSMGVVSHGEYGVPKGLVFSYPVKCTGNWRYEIVRDLEISEICKQKIEENYKELVGEKENFEDYE